MKKIILVIAVCLYTSLMFSKVFPVYDVQKDEIYGYLIFSLIEQTDKNTNLYMVSLLDVNLNGVAQATFTDGKRIGIGNIRYNGKTIFFEILPEVSRTTANSRDYSYRIYHLKENRISERYELPEELQHRQTYIRGGYPIQDVGYGIIIRDFKRQINRLYAISDANNLVYETFPYGSEKKRETEHLVVGDILDNILAIISTRYDRPKSKDPYTTLLLVDVNTGKTIKEVSFDTKTYDMDITNIQIADGKVIVYGDTYLKKHTIPSGKTAGMFKAETDLQGNKNKQKELVWADFQSKIDIKEGGFVRKKGYIYTHSYVFDKETKHTIAVGEYIEGALKSVKVEDMVFLDFDENFNLAQVFEVETVKSTLQLDGIKFGGSRGYGGILKNYNYFDYRFYNFLENESGLTFYYFNLEKLRLFKRSFSHGVVVYKNGKFSNNKLEWDLNMWKQEYLELLPSKPGYILLSKVNKDKILENRLEKIDY